MFHWVSFQHSKFSMGYNFVAYKLIGRSAFLGLEVIGVQVVKRAINIFCPLLFTNYLPQIEVVTSYSTRIQSLWSIVRTVHGLYYYCCHIMSSSGSHQFLFQVRGLGFGTPDFADEEIELRRRTSQGQVTQIWSIPALIYILISLFAPGLHIMCARPPSR